MIKIVDDTGIPHFHVHNVTTRQLLLTGTVGGVVGVVLTATAFSFAFPPERQKREWLSDKKRNASHD